MKILLCAEESAGIQAIRATRNSGHEIVAVLTGAGKTTNGNFGATVEGTAAHFGYPVWPATEVKDPAFATVVRNESVDLLLNVHSLHLVHEKVLSAVRVGAFNLHPGPLPDYAGMNAPSWAIMKGEKQHGVTLHWMDSGIDEGPIAFQTMFDLKPDDTALAINRRCSRLGLKLIDDLLSLKPAEIPRLKQNISKRRYHGFEIPFDARVPWQSAELVARFVRACHFYPLPSPWGIPTLRYCGKELGLIEVSVTDRICNVVPETVEFRDNKCYVATGDHWLELKRVLHKSKLIAAGDLPGRLS